MKVTEFDYYDWDVFEDYLNSLPDKDAAKLLAVISKVDEYIARRSRQSATFAKEYKEENQRLQVSVEVRTLHDKLGMTQQENL